MQNKIESLPKAYEGNEPYIFISYRHLDKDKVFPVIKKLQDEFYRVWYDDGIKPGTDWNNYIESHLRNCQVFIAFFSKNYFQSEYCIKELEIARQLGKDFTYINLDDDLDKDSLYNYFFNNRNLKVTQGILKKDLNNNNTDIYKKLLEFDLLGECRNAVQYDSIEECYFDQNNKLVAAMKNKNSITIIKNDKIAFEGEANGVQDLENGYHEVMINDKVCFRDINEKQYGGYYDDAKGFNEGIAAVMINNKWGFINEKGEIIKEPIFKDAYCFKNGYCVIADKYGRYGVIDNKFDYYIKPKYLKEDNVINEYLYEEKYYEEEILYNDTSFDSIMDEILGKEKETSEDKTKHLDKKKLVKIRIKGQEMYIDYDGKIIYGEYGYNNVVKVENNHHSDETEIIDNTDEQSEKIGKKKNILPKNVYSEIHEFSKWFIVRKNKKYGFIDKNGKVLTECIFDDYFKAIFDNISKYINSMCAEECHRFVKVDDKWGLIDDDGNFIIEPKFNDVWTINLKGNNKYVGVTIDEIMIQNDACDEDNNEIFGGEKLLTSAYKAVIDCKGKYIIKPTNELSYIEQMNNFNYCVENFSDIVLKAKSIDLYKYEEPFYKYDFIINGKKNIIPRFDEICDFVDDMCKVKFEDKWGYVDLNGEVVIEEKYDTATDFFYGCAIVSIANRYGVIDKTGKEIIKLQFNDATFDYDGNGGGLGVFIKVLLGTKEGYILNPGYNIKNNIE